MSRRLYTVSLASSLADDPLRLLPPMGARHQVLMALQLTPGLDARALQQQCAPGTGRAEFAVQILGRLQRAQLVRFDAQDDGYHITRLGVDALAQLQRVHQAPGRDVAQPRSASPTAPLPATEYRCPRPGAYDHTRWPSLQSGARVYRADRPADGGVAPLSIE